MGTGDQLLNSKEGGWRQFTGKDALIPHAREQSGEGMATQRVRTALENREAGTRAGGPVLLALPWDVGLEPSCWGLSAPPAG